MKTGLTLQQPQLYHPTNNTLLIIPPTERKKSQTNQSSPLNSKNKEKGDIIIPTRWINTAWSTLPHTTWQTYRRHNSSLAKATVKGNHLWLGSTVSKLAPVIPSSLSFIISTKWPTISWNCFKPESGKIIDERSAPATCNYNHKQ